MQKQFAVAGRFLLLCYCLVATRVTADASLHLNGIASYWAQTSETYLAALYVEEPAADADKLLKSEQKKRMDMRVTAKHWPPSSFARQWKKAIVDNNEPAVKNRYAGDIQAWVSMVKGPLQKGDRIVVDYTPGKITVVSINGVEMVRFSRPDFFNVLLKTWVGEHAPYTDFREQILHTDTASAQNLLKRFGNIRPGDMAGRKKTIRQWLSQEGENSNHVSAADSDVAKNMYRLGITRAILRHVIYPSRALRSRQEGTAIVRITLNSKGRLLGHEIHQSSQYDRLDKAAIEAVKRSSFPAFPETIMDEELDFLVPVRFVLP